MTEKLPILAEEMDGLWAMPSMSQVTKSHDPWRFSVAPMMDWSENHIFTF